MASVGRVCGSGGDLTRCGGDASAGSLGPSVLGSPTVCGNALVMLRAPLALDGPRDGLHSCDVVIGGTDCSAMDCLAMPFLKMLLNISMMWLFLFSHNQGEMLSLDDQISARMHSLKGGLQHVDNGCIPSVRIADSDRSSVPIVDARMEGSDTDQLYVDLNPVAGCVEPRAAMPGCPIEELLVFGPHSPTTLLVSGLDGPGMEGSSFTREDVGFGLEGSCSKSVVFSVHFHLFNFQHRNIFILTLLWWGLNSFLRQNFTLISGLTNMVYPGAVHSRFEHSLGVYWLAGEAVHKLQAHQGLELGIDPFDIQTVKLAGN
ncbi:hypothetical protein HHK36_024920 [Tetracentron sinense]|uniref:Uncharacterized protein n=1 Tax=Tetracentron sinense TaxID=13715 RepID=A0A835D7Y2_TETSI|nr:hypothetical protein HHK36_024920 [Tetracentron sinense]